MPPSHNALAQALAAQNFAAVEKYARELIADQPNHHPTWQALGVAQLRQNRPVEAIKSFEHVISLGGSGANLRFELACALEQTGRWADAVVHLQQAVALDPQAAEAHINLAALLEKLDRPEEALIYSQRATMLSPRHAIAHYNLASVLQSLGRLDEAIASYSKVIQLDGQFALAYTNRGCCHLLRVNNASGWPDYEWRLRTSQVKVTPYPQPRWNGQPLPGGTLLVHAEQGIGDEILFASCLPEAVTRVGKCVLVCDPRLEKLMARSFPAITVIGHQRQSPGSPAQLPLPIDAQIPAGSLPLHLRATAEAYPRRKRFLLADPEKKRLWHKRFAALGPGLKVGISWRGGGTWEERRRRTTTLDQWSQLLSLSGVHFINLQYGDCQAELAAIQRAPAQFLNAESHDSQELLSIKIHHFEDADPLGNLDDFAAKVAALDLVISVGNAAVHLAGALGLPTWCLLPQVPQWRWGLQGETCHWYPSVRLLRQSQRGDWDGLLSDVACQLRELIHNNRNTNQPSVIKNSAVLKTQPVRKTQPQLLTAPVRVAPNKLHASPSTPASAVSEWLQQATAHFNENRFAAAGQLAEKVLAANADNVVALRICGVAARKAQQLDRSLELLTHALRLAPEHSVLHFELGLTFLELKRHREAYECYLKSAQLNPSFQPACVNLSAILEQQERYEEAMVWARQAAKLKADCPLSHYNLANQLRECGRVAEAVEHYQTAIQLRPDYIKAKWNLAICYVLLGRFVDAWPLHEFRDEAEEVKLDKFTQPRWDGSPLAEKSIVVHAEQGIGDEVLFASCFPDMIAQGGKTILVCEPRLVKLFARSFPQATVYGWARHKDWSPMPLAESIDYQIPAGSLPLHFRTTAESFPQRERFLTADPDSVDQWRRRFAEFGLGLKIGISWRAGGKATEGRKRTINLIDWRDILTTSNVHFVNLQYGDVSEDVAQVERELGVHVHDFEQGDPLVDLDGYAAKIAALDLVISVGNAAVHLAGAMGTPAWTLLPRVPSWRWMVTGDVSPWYSSVRLFRQPQRCQWEPVLHQITARLKEVACFAAQGMSADAVAQQIRAVLPQNEPPDSSPIQPPSNPGPAWLDADQLSCRQPLEVIAALQEQAEQSYRSRHFAEAERLYREILQITPRHMKAHARLGLIARETGRLDLAIRSLQRALNIYEPHPDNHAHLAAVFTDAGRAPEALSHAQRSLELDPKLPPAHRELGRALQLLGNSADAIKTLHRTLQMSPGDTSAICALGQSLLVAGHIDEALELLRQAIQKSPNSPLLHLALGRVLLEDQCLDDAADCFHKALELQPSLGEAHHELARIFILRGQSEAAIAANRQALEHAPLYLPALSHLASLLRQHNALAEAESLYRRALELQPENALFHHGLGATLVELDRSGEALSQFDRALQLQPDDVAIHVDRARLLLQAQRFAEGWEEYQWRLRSGQQSRYTQFAQPLWNGSSLARQTILVHGEQSVANEIMFATCYPDVLQQAKRCVIVCEARLERLFRRSFPQALVLGVPQGSEHSWRLPENFSIDVQCSAGTLPHYLRKSAEEFPRQRQLLTADTDRVAAWQSQWATLGSGKKIGISWRTDHNTLDSISRSLALAQWLPLLSMPGIHWINLQSGDYRGELAALSRQGVKICDQAETNRQYDLDNAAAMIAALDLVIAVDNTTAHLAAALGTPTWIVLPTPADWYWLTGRDDSVWYQSVRLFRQSGLQQSSEVFRQLREELLKRSFRLDEKSRIGPPSSPHWLGVHARDKR
jgi:tetratricopeptide (TPR) repeat protein